THTTHIHTHTPHTYTHTHTHTINTHTHKHIHFLKRTHTLAHINSDKLTHTHTHTFRMSSTTSVWTNPWTDSPFTWVMRSPAQSPASWADPPSSTCCDWTRQRRRISHCQDSKKGERSEE